MTGETEVRESIDHLFRRNAGQMVSVLCRIFGVQNIGLIEDCVQDAFISALRKWPYGDVPANRFAWLIQTARNRAIDHLRRDKKSAPIDGRVEAAANLDPAAPFTDELCDDLIKMIFACCHPAISPDSQVAITLKLVGGFSVAEIAKAYLASEDAVAKMLSRARGRLRSGEVDLEIPAGEELEHRLAAVLRVLYLMFNEGYAATTGEDVIRGEHCLEAIRLAVIISGHPRTNRPEVHALLALFHFQAARLNARTNAEGDLLLLAEQDRTLWNAEHIYSGMLHLRRSASGNTLSDYHIEAEIASAYVLSEDHDSIDWHRIVACYDQLLARSYSPVIDLNRAIAVRQIEGPERALEMISEISANYLVASFDLFHITRAHFLNEVGRLADSAEAYEKASALTRNESVKRYIEKRIGQLAANA